jgi:hypothetical protein
MKLMLSTATLAAALTFASVAHAGPITNGAGPGGGGPVNPGDPGDEPDYYQDAFAGISGDDSGSTGTGVNAVPVNPIGSTNYFTPNYGTNAGLGGAMQGGSIGNPGGLAGVGQVFTSTGGTLNQISFVDTNSAKGGEQLNIALINTAAGFGPDNISANAGLVGPVIFTASTTTLTNFGDGGGVNGNDALFYHTYSNLNLSLAAGQSYYAFVTQTPGSTVFDGSNSGYQSRAYFFELATQTSSLGGYALGEFTNNAGYFRVANAAAGTAPFLQAYYDISITPNATAPVPEVATWAMMIAGFGLAGTALRRRRTAVAFAA